MHTVLENLYHEMIPLCSRLIGAAQLIAGFGALFFIGYRVWKHIANAEAIEFFPLLRPFAIGMAISFFPTILGVINAVLSPTVTVTQSMVNGAQDDIQRLLHQRELASNGKGPSVLLTDPGGKQAWDQYANNDTSGGFWSSLLTLNFTQLCKLFISTLLELLYYAASLCIDCMRTFHLVILAILGPFVLAISVYDGFQHTLTIWLGRYINIYLWLPIANLFGALIGRIQVSMLQLDITQIVQGQEGYFSQTDAAYIIFLIIGVIGYLTIPSVANHIVHASGGGALMNKVNTIIASRINISRIAGSKMSTTNQSVGSTGQGSSSSGNAGAFMKSKLTGK
jgi:conjugative transposon TraJ protein